VFSDYESQLPLTNVALCWISKLALLVIFTTQALVSVLLDPHAYRQTLLLTKLRSATDLGYHFEGGAGALVDPRGLCHLNAGCYCGDVSAPTSNLPHHVLSLILYLTRLPSVAQRAYYF